MKKRVLVVAKMLKDSGKNAVMSESNWNDFIQRARASVDDVDWEKLCGIGGKFVVNIAGSSSSDMIPFAQVAAEYAALHILDAITILRGNITIQQMIEHLENSVYGLQAKEKDVSRPEGFFSSLIAKVKSTVMKKTSVSLLFRTFDSKEIKEINVHDLFALPGVNVAGQLYSGALCNPGSFGYMHGTMNLVSLRSAVITASTPLTSSNDKQKKVTPPLAYPRIVTNRDRAWELFTNAVEKKEFSPSDEATLCSMISKDEPRVIGCCTAHASYESVMINWKAILKSQLSSLSASTKALSLMSQAHKKQLISEEEKERLVALISEENKFILACTMTEDNSLEETVGMWKIHLRKKE